MIRDRGLTKWAEAFKFPERGKMEKNYFLSDLKVKKPELDEQQIEEINVKIAESMEFNQELVFYYFINGEIRYIVGKVHYVDTNKREFRIIDEYGHLNKIKFDEIVDVENK